MFIAGWIAGFIGAILLGKAISERRMANDERTDRDP
jgi:hypothetical protein